MLGLCAAAALGATVSPQQEPLVPDNKNSLVCVSTLATLAANHDHSESFWKKSPRAFAFSSEKIPALAAHTT